MLTNEIRVCLVTWGHLLERVLRLDWMLSRIAVVIGVQGGPVVTSGRWLSIADLGICIAVD